MLHILLALSTQERHGYGILKEAEFDSQGKVKMGLGTLYGSIGRMIEAGLIRESDKRVDPEMDDERRVYYKITGPGRESHRERFGEAMEQTLNDLCRERVPAERGLFNFALWTFFETSAAIIRENAAMIVRCSMKLDSRIFLKIVKYSAITLSAFMVAGIATLMVLSRGKGEDITGIVAPALLITFVSSAVATVAAVLQKRAQGP